MCELLTLGAVDGTIAHVLHEKNTCHTHVVLDKFDLNYSQ
jgi:hypothetical protein